MNNHKKKQNSRNYLKTIKKIKLFDYNPLFVSILVLISFLFSYLYGYHNKNVVIYTKFDELTYRMNNESYDKIFHGLITCNEHKDESFYSNLHYQTVYNTMYEGIESYVFAGNIEEQKPFSLVFNGFEDLSFESNGISQLHYSDKNYKLNLINIELYNETSSKKGGTFFYLPSSIANTLIELSVDKKYNSYDDIINNLKVSILVNDQNKTPIEIDLPIVNIFYDEYSHSNYQGLDNYQDKIFGYGASIKKFLGSFFVSNSKKMYDYTGAQLGFTTRSSHFSFKNYIKEFYYENSDIDDAFVKIYGLKDNTRELVFNEPSVNALFEPEIYGRQVGILALSLSLFLFITVIIITINKYKKGLAADISKNGDRFQKSLLFNYFLAIMIPFCIIHLVYSLFLNNNYSLFSLRMYNIIGNIYTILGTLIYLALNIFFYYLRFKKVRRL